MEPKRTSKAAEVEDEERGYYETCIDFTFPNSIQGCAGQPGGDIKHRWLFRGVTNYVHPFVAHL
jgi:hypothetical protein